MRKVPAAFSIYRHTITLGNIIIDMSATARGRLEGGALFYLLMQKGESARVATISSSPANNAAPFDEHDERGRRFILTLARSAGARQAGLTFTRHFRLTASDTILAILSAATLLMTMRRLPRRAAMLPPR